MSRLDSTDKGRGVLVSKPKADIYTVLLGIALGSILLGIICLLLELNRYNFDVKATVQLPARQQATGDATWSRLAQCAPLPTWEEA